MNLLVDYIQESKELTKSKAEKLIDKCYNKFEISTSELPYEELFYSIIPDPKATKDDIVDLFNLAALMYKKNGDVFRNRALLKSSKIISSLPFDIRSIHQIKGMKDIGEGTLKRVKEIIETGHLSELKKDPDLFATYTFTKVSGIGPVAAKKFVDKGYNTLKDLEDANLTKHQKIGLKYYKDFLKKIPYDEIEYVSGIISEQIKGKTKYDIAGSHRRKAPFSGDIDVMLTHPEDKNILHTLVKKLHEIGLLTDDISLGKVKYMGVYNLKNYQTHNNLENIYKDVARRIDIRFIPIESYYPALLHSTGSAKFNADIRQYAKSKGYKLSEYELSKSGKKIEVDSEKDIFEKLNYKYIPPEQR